MKFARNRIYGRRTTGQVSAQAYISSRREFIAGALLFGSVRLSRAGGLEPALPIVGLDHLSIHVSDVRRSAEFYTKLFGVEVSRDPHRGANPGSTLGELWFIRLGESHLSISPLSPNERSGMDHFCFAIAGFDRSAMKPRLAGFNQPWPDWPSGLWVKDPDGHIIQIAASTSSPRLPAIVRDAVVVASPGGGLREPAFLATHITQLVLAMSNPAVSEPYYRKLLGDESANRGAHRFKVGQSELLLAPSSVAESFRIGVGSFDLSATVRKLTALGIVAQVVRDKTAVSFADPDGIHVEIGGS